jgi:mono/diheme cytochrome c family protein
MSQRHFPMQSWSRLYAPALALAAFALALSLLPSSNLAQSPVASPGDAALREQGRQVFTEKCGKCHDADAAKKLPDGSSLLGRLAARKDPQAKLSTRLKSMSDQDARGVALYMEDLLARFRTAQRTSAEK